ncbi:MAG: GGDEF domain-containing protein [Moraxellaceae bacterium]|nr:MAG: GGDEF domain-containing protein [Moraxellaceae bacterium]
MGFNNSIVRYFDDVLDWTPVRKSLLVLVILIVILVHYWVFQIYQTFFPSKYINYKILMTLQWGLPLLILLTSLLVYVGKKVQDKDWAQQLFACVSTFYYSIALVILGYTIGLSNITTGLVMAGAPLFGFVLFQRQIVYAAFGTAAALIIGLSTLSAYGYIPYGPLFKPEFFYAFEARPVYLLCMIYFALPHFITIFGFCDLFFIRWRQRERNIHHISITDSLTNLYNRRAITNCLEIALAKNVDLVFPVSVVILDVDLFKRINDAHGHAIGDKALQVVAATLQSTLRKADQVGRYGGEEFLIVLSQTELEQAVIIAERCRVAIANAYVSDEQDQRLQVTASFGVSCSEQCGYQLDKIVRQADKYLYEAKHQGRDQVVSILNTIRT